jgi:hypothetical protein
MFAVLLLATPATAQTTGDCLVAEVPMAMVLPDGSEHDAGDLRICMSHEYSPVAGLHKTSVDGRVIGLFQSRSGYSEAAVDNRSVPLVLFHKDGEDRLILVGFAWPDGQRMRTFRMMQYREEMQTGMAKGGEEITADTVLLAALVN